MREPVRVERAGLLERRGARIGEHLGPLGVERWRAVGAPGLGLRRAVREVLEAVVPADELLGDRVQEVGAPLTDARGHAAVLGQGVDVLDAGDHDAGRRLALLRQAVQQASHVGAVVGGPGEADGVVHAEHDEHEVVRRQRRVADPGVDRGERHHLVTDVPDVDRTRRATRQGAGQLAGERELVGDRAPAVRRAVADQEHAVGIIGTGGDDGRVPWHGHGLLDVDHLRVPELRCRSDRSALQHVVAPSPWGFGVPGDSPGRKRRTTRPSRRDGSGTSRSGSG